MTINEFNDIILHIKDCNDYLEGRIHTQTVQHIARAGAEKAVQTYKQALLLDLKNAGLKLEN